MILFRRQAVKNEKGRGHTESPLDHIPTTIAAIKVTPRIWLIINGIASVKFMHVSINFEWLI